MLVVLKHAPDFYLARQRNFIHTRVQLSKVSIVICESKKVKNDEGCPYRVRVITLTS